MLMQDINDDDITLQKYAAMLKDIKYERLYLNTPVRPPTDLTIKTVGHEKMSHAEEILGGISIDLLVSEGFHSEVKDDYTAIISIIKRHPMNHHEIKEFLKSRGCSDIDTILKSLKQDDRLIIINYKDMTLTG